MLKPSAVIGTSYLPCSIISGTSITTRASSAKLLNNFRLKSGLGGGGGGNTFLNY
jgi:hypothetical protein